MATYRLIDLVSDKINGEWGNESINGNGVSVIRTTNFTNNGRINFDNVVIREIDENIIKRKKLIFGDVIIEKSGGSPTQPVGRVVYFEVTSDKEYLCNNFTTTLRPNNLVFPKYFFYLLYQNHLTKKTLKFQNKTTGILNLKLERYLEEKVDIPSIDRQKQIAETLDKADDLRLKRKKAIGLLDEYLRSVFYDMFGDPVKNEKGWEKIEFGKIMKSIRYGTGSPPIYSEKGIPFIRATNIKKGTVIDKDMKFISEEEAKKITKCKLKEGDLILVRSGINSGDSGYINKKYSSSYAGFDLIIEINYPYNIFYNYFINSMYGKSILKPLSRRAGQPHLNADQIKGIEVIKPSDNLLAKFAQIVEQVEKTKAKMQESLKEMDNLFNSLMQQAFKG